MEERCSFCGGGTAAVRCLIAGAHGEGLICSTGW